MENTENTTSSSKKMNPMLIIVGVIAVLAIVGGAMAFMNKGEKAETQNSTVTEEPVQTEQTLPQGSADPNAPGTVGGDAMQAQTFTVEGGNFYFKPNELRVKKGQPVTVTFNNVEGFHDFVIDEVAGAKTQRIQTGTSETITFTADTAGSFEFYCSVGSHRQMGMKGTLIVEE